MHQACGRKRRRGSNLGERAAEELLVRVCAADAAGAAQSHVGCDGSRGRNVWKRLLNLSLLLWLLLLLLLRLNIIIIVVIIAIAIHTVTVWIHH